MLPPDDERLAFYRAVRARLDDDVPRLAFADYLDEHGEPAWAEFIRVQCEVARHGEDNARERHEKSEEFLAWQRQYLALEREEYAAFGKFCKDVGVLYLPPRPGLYSWWPLRSRNHDETPDEWTVGFHRGFPRDVTLPGDDWVRMGDQFGAAAIPLETVMLTSLPELRCDETTPTSAVGGFAADPRPNLRFRYAGDPVYERHKYYAWLLEQRWPHVPRFEIHVRNRRGE